MNELNCNSICHLLCCPPVPSKIAAKLAFMPPPASYELSLDETSGKLSFVYAPFMRETFMAFVPDNLEVTTATTRRGNRIAIVYMRNNPSSKLTFLLSHGNAVDLGLMVTFMHELGTKLNVNMMCYDYSGYGASTGKPLEKNLYADAECALEVLQKEFGVPLRQVVLYGQSIGTVPTVHLATLYRVAAVVLHSPLMSGLRVAFPRLRRNYCCDVFSNLTRASRIISPTLIIHGTRDDVVHVNHGQRICSALADHLVLDPLFIEGAGHNDCEMFPQYLMRLAKLTNVEIPQMDEKTSSLEALVHSLEKDENLPEDDQDDLSACSGSTSSSSTDNETELSPSSSTRLSPDLLNTSSGDGFKHKTRPNFKKISPILADQLRMLLSKRTNNLFRKLSTRSARSVPSEEQHASTTYGPKRSCVAACSAPQQIIRTPFAPCNTGTKPDASVEDVNDVVISQRISSHSSAVCESGSKSSEELEDLLPPPPPPPPDTQGLLISNELLWHIHQSKYRKTFTLPRDFPPPGSNKYQAPDNLTQKDKTCTLPRMFSPTAPFHSNGFTEGPPTSFKNLPDSALIKSSGPPSRESLPNTDNPLHAASPPQAIST
ncbi:hypothetical protein T265_00188 [Opisthorchis viverrini]|uniref:Serine aminopeptidase S33 domain-containing protein n=1 Tax=Opisthorchis viverrini TaxID=6198 RepID=A0A075A2P2_OPIVI|nr:hypothetical protein T265_00188 [Opisthorchis viverrini]KER33983.1 hypothetical protein T265_00188 [Opisthorchis viverrini]